ESITAISAVIRWNTTEAANSSVSYGTAVSMLNESSSSASMTQGHGLTIQTLTKNTTYYYNVTSCDDIANCNTSGPRSFLTCIENWSCSSWSSCSGGIQTRTCNDLNSCGSISERPALSQSCDDGGGSRGRTTTSPPQNVTSRPELVPGVGIINNTRLQDAIEMVLERANLSETAMDNLMRLSKSITQNVSAERNMYFSGTTTKLRTKIIYAGQNKIKNFMLFEKVPKLFASSAGLVNITAPGAVVRIVEEDPSWLITWPEVTPGDELSITYETLGRKSSTVPGSTETEIYAESLEEITEPAQQVNITEPVSCTPLVIRCHGKEVQQCSTGGDAWTVLETCDNECDPQTLSCALEPAPERPGFSFDMIPVIIILVIVLFVVIVFMGAKSIKRGKKPRPIPGKREETKKKEPKIEEKPKPIPEKKEATKEKPLLHRPEEISKDIREGEPDVIMAGVETGKRAFVKKHLKSVAGKLPIKRPVEGEETKEKPTFHKPEEISKDIKDGEPDVALADIEIVRKAAPEKHLEKATKKTPLKKPATKETVKKKVKKRMDAAERIEAVRPDVTVVTLSDIHRIAKKRKKKEKPPKKIADTDARLKKIGKVAFEMPKMRLNLEALGGEMEGHEETVTEVRRHEDNLHWQVEEVMTSLSSLRNNITEKMAKKKMEEKEADKMLEKTSKSINTKVNIMSSNLDESLEKLSKKMDESSKIGKLQMESNIQFLRNQIEQLRSELPKHAGKKDIEKIKRKRKKKEDSPEE
ncbi:MAG: fibronectin type III domain-containing protein, partial [Candidatus Aenigmarchaeota archaeon]|nr:fibronectin type III domain-containing protein [Candidatus Aenigmarchaeota archaeon]